MQVAEEVPLILTVFARVIKLQTPPLLNCLHIHLDSYQYHGGLLTLKREWDLFGEAEDCIVLFY